MRLRVWGDQRLRAREPGQSSMKTGRGPPLTSLLGPPTTHGHRVSGEAPQILDSALGKLASLERTEWRAPPVRAKAISTLIDECSWCPKSHFCARVESYCAREKNTSARYLGRPARSLRSGIEGGGQGPSRAGTRRYDIVGRIRTALGMGALSCDSQIPPRPACVRAPRRGTGFL